MWGLGGNMSDIGDMVFVHAAAQALYYSGFGFMIISYFILLAIYIIIVYRDDNHFMVLNDVGKILCKVTMIPLLIGNIFILIASCIYMDDYRTIGTKLDSFVKFRALDGPVPGKYWGAAIVPFIFLIITSVLIVFCLNALYSIFNKNIYTSISEAKTGKNEGISVNVEINNNSSTPGNFNNNPNINLNNNQVNNNPMNPQGMNNEQNYGSNNNLNNF